MKTAEQGLKEILGEDRVKHLNNHMTVKEAIEFAEEHANQKVLQVLKEIKNNPYPNAKLNVEYNNYKALVRDET